MAITCTIDATGIHAPTYADVLAYLRDQYRGIYGADVYLEPDSQDGQLLAIFARALHDANNMAIAVYNAFSPATAQGAGLSSVVKINGIRRAAPSNSTVDLLLTGTAGTTITNGVVADTAGNRWNLPASVTIPPGGTITVTATAAEAGAVIAAAGTVTRILTITPGWVSVTNPAAAAPGAPVESDAALRRRQGISVALPSRTVLEGIIGAIANLPGVARYAAYENDTGTTDANGIPPHSIALVVEGGDAQAIAAAIAAKKTPGAGTYGSTAETVTDAYGVPHAIRFSRPTGVPIGVAITLKAFAGYTTATGQAIQAAVADYINALAIGCDVPLTKLYLPANLVGSADGATFDITSLAIGRDGATPTAANIPIAFDEAAICTPDAVVLTVVP